MCTGNVCRSPMAEALLQERLSERGVDALVSSAGVATADLPPTDEVIELLQSRKIDMTAHRSRLLIPAMVASADLIVGMAREHVREVSILDPSAFSRTFTLVELVRLGEAVGPRDTDQALADWLKVLGEDRTPAAHLTLTDADDVDDPIGRRFGVFKRVFGEIDDLTTRLVDLGWPDEP